MIKPNIANRFNCHLYELSMWGELISSLPVNFAVPLLDGGILCRRYRSKGFLRVQINAGSRA